MRLRDEASDDLEAGGPGKDGIAGLEFTDFELYLIGFRFADVGRVGDDEVEGVGFESSKQVGLVKLDSRIKLMPGGVSAGDFKSRRRDVDSVDFGLRQLFGQGQRDAARASAHVGNA